jgi:hypothetical protein
MVGSGGNTAREYMARDRTHRRVRVHASRPSSKKAENVSKESSPLAGVSCYEQAFPQLVTLAEKNGTAASELLPDATEPVPCRESMKPKNFLNVGLRKSGSALRSARGRGGLALEQIG